MMSEEKTESKEDRKKGRRIPTSEDAPPSAAELNHLSARRAVVQEMYVRSVKNLLRRDLRGAMEMGAGALEIEQIVANTANEMTQNRRHIMGIDSGVRNSRPQNGSWVYPESARHNPE